jgi:hypothetical protein
MKSFVIALPLLLSAPVFGAPAEALAQSHNGCGSAGRFALMPHRIDPKYEAWERSADCVGNSYAK